MTTTAGSVSRFEPIAVSNESTVVAEFVADPTRDAAYQSEAQLERAFIEQLREQAYEYLPVTSNDQLVANLRRQLELLNGIVFSDTEWERFFTERVAPSGDGIVEKTARIQEDEIQVLARDDGSFKNVRLIDKRNVRRTGFNGGVVSRFLGGWWWSTLSRHRDQSGSFRQLTGWARS